MNLLPMSDLSMSLALQRQSRDVRTALERAGFEMTTGRKSDLVTATRGGVDRVFAIDRMLTTLAQQNFDLSQAGGRSGATQLFLGTVQDASGTIGTELSASVSRGDLSSARIQGKAAIQALERVVGALNGSFGGRFLFSGAAEDRPALASSETIRTDIAALLGAAPDAATGLTAVDAYFAPGGTFETSIYGGATEDAAGISTPDGNRINYMLRADAQPFRDMLKGLAIASAFDPGMFAGDVDEMTVAFKSAASTMSDAAASVVGLRADLGVAEEDISSTRAFVAAQKNSFDLARGELAGTDPYEAATRFADLENQLTAVYTVNARLSNLNLTNFLR